MVPPIDPPYRLTSEQVSTDTADNGCFSVISSSSSSCTEFALLLPHSLRSSKASGDHNSPCVVPPEFASCFDKLSLKEREQALRVKRDTFMAVVMDRIDCVSCRRGVEEMFDRLCDEYCVAVPGVELNSCSCCGISVHPKLLTSASICYSLIGEGSVELEKLNSSSLDSGHGGDCGGRSRRGGKRRKMAHTKRCDLHSAGLDIGPRYSGAKKTSQGHQVAPWQKTWQLLKVDGPTRANMLIVDRKDMDVALELYLKRHLFCSHCRARVAKVYAWFRHDGCPNHIDQKESDYDPSLFDSIYYCPDDHIHVSVDIEFLEDLMSLADVPFDPLLAEERHASTDYKAQTEFLNALGCLLRQRFERLHWEVLAQDRLFKLLKSAVYTAMARSLEISSATSEMESLLLDEEAEKKLEHKQSKCKNEPCYRASLRADSCVGGSKKKKKKKKSKKNATSVAALKNAQAQEIITANITTTITTTTAAADAAVPTSITTTSTTAPISTSSTEVSDADTVCCDNCCTSEPFVGDSKGDFDLVAEMRLLTCMGWDSAGSCHSDAASPVEDGLPPLEISEEVMQIVKKAQLDQRERIRRRFNNFCNAVKK